MYCIMPAAEAIGKLALIKPTNTASGAVSGTKPPDAALIKDFIPLLSTAKTVYLFVTVVLLRRLEKFSPLALALNTNL